MAIFFINIFSKEVDFSVNLFVPRGDIHILGSINASYTLFKRFVTALGVTHTLSYIIVSLVITRDNKICDKLQYLSRHAFI